LQELSENTEYRNTNHCCFCWAYWNVMVLISFNGNQGVSLVITSHRLVYTCF